MGSNYENRVIIEMTTLMKEYLFAAGKKSTYDSIMGNGSFRSWIVPVLFREAEQVLGLSFDEWSKKKGKNNEDGSHI